ncbi:hypothetical protein CHELA20_51311 [Hyphomicrobiales bacterium]|nr:hypothetical protein CHELA20_51311 [Hyphomicrobiales bacterium]
MELKGFGFVLSHACVISTVEHLPQAVEPARPNDVCIITAKHMGDESGSHS